MYEFAPDSVTPTKRGATFTAAVGVGMGFHWLALTLVLIDDRSNYDALASDVMRAVNRHTGAKSDDPRLWVGRRGQRGYRHLAIGPMGVNLHTYPHCPTSSGMQHMHLVLRGQWLEIVTMDHVRQLMRELAELFELRCTRLDVAFDHATFAVPQAWDAIEHGNIRVKCRRLRPGGSIATDPIRLIVPADGGAGHTIYAGSRTSRRYVRIYDIHGFTRVELEIKSQRAQLAMEDLLLHEDSDDQAAIKAMGMLRSYVDFVSHWPGGNISRAPLLPWWEEFVQGAIPVRHTLRRPESTIDLRENWLRKKVSLSLAMTAMTKEDPETYLRELYAYGLRRLKPDHHKAIAEHRLMRAQVGGL